MAYSIDIEDAFSALRELLDGRDRGTFSDAEFFQRVADCGPLFCIEIEDSATVAGNFIKLYKPRYHLKGFLAAIAAREGKLNAETNVLSARSR